MGDKSVFLATNRARILKAIETGDPLHPHLRAWTFGNEAEDGGSQHLLQVTGQEDISGFFFPRWVEYSREKAFFEAVMELAKRQVKSITLYVHGFDNDFKRAVKGLGELQQDLFRCGYKGLVLGLDWPSMGGIHLYPQDRQHAEASVDQAFDLLGRLQVWCSEKGLKLCVVCHSMGNYLFSLVARKWLWYSEQVPRPWVNYLAMVGADVSSTLFNPSDRGSMIDPAGRGLAEMCRKIGILYSGRDKVLFLCEHIERPDEPRLGRVGPDDVILPPNVSAVDMAARGVSSHGGYFSGGPLQYLAELLIATESGAASEGKAPIYHPKGSRRKKTSGRGLADASVKEP